jgi:photosystem II stability/assembly factor-like uncharacterized protein
MRTYSRWSLVVLIPLLCIPGLSRAQWNIAAPALLKATDTVGAMQFHDGIVWAGGNTLWSSLDSGKTWQQNVAFPTASISDIAFYDKLHGMVATLDKGFFITVNGGLSWLQPQQFSKANIIKVGYDGSNSILLALTIDALFIYSTDGGVNWGTHFTYPDSTTISHAFAVAEDGTIYANCFNKNYGFVAVSTDTGQSWYSMPGTFNGGSWTVSVDSCDPKRLFVGDEEAFGPTDSISSFYLSTDGGQNWQITDTHHAPYLSGTISTTTDGIVIGTVNGSGSGVRRSMDRGMTWKDIGGPNICTETRNLTTINDNFVLAVDSGGNIWLTTNGGGDSVQSQPAGTLTLAPNQIFSKDTVTCNPIQRAISIVRSGCPVPRLISEIISGPDSASFRIDSVGIDSIYITILPQTIGAKKAVLIGQLDNDSQQIVQLGGYVSQYAGTFTISPNTLFTNITISCESITAGVALTSSGCRPPSLTHIGITGPDANSFRIVDSTSDSIYVIWTSQIPGAQTAWLVAQLSNGQLDSIPLQGFSKTTPVTYNLTPSSLFNADSLYYSCSSPTSEKLILTFSACIWPNVDSEHISGPDSGDYSITSPIVSPVSALDSVTILFSPTDTGLRPAVYKITLNDGTVIDVPLSGVGLTTHILSLSSANQKTDTVGGTIAVPITINGLAHSETVDVVLHYPVADMDYVGSVDLTGKSVDVTAPPWFGRSLLQIPNAAPGAVAAYAKFNVFSDTNYLPFVTFDSVTVPTSIAVCQYKLPLPITDTITPMEGCGIQLLSQWIHTGKPIVLNFAPNPTSDGSVMLTSSENLSDARIEVYDMLGSERRAFPTSLKANVPTTVSLPFESGLYFLRVMSSEGTINLRVMIDK